MPQGKLATIEYRDDQPVLIFGDTRAACARGRSAAQAAGLRVAAAEALKDGEACLARMPSMPVAVELDGCPPAGELIPILDRMALAAEAGIGGVVAAPSEAIDLVAARVFHPAVTHLCAPSDAQRHLAYRLAAVRRGAVLHDVSREGDALMQHALLHQLSEEVGRIAGILASLSDEDEAVATLKPGLSHEAPEEGIDAGQIRAIIRARRLREQFFRADLFADPAWDMLLDLMAARIEKKRVAVSSLCIAAAVPATTALRWIKALTDRGLFLRSADPQDGRRVYIELSEETAKSVCAYLKAAQRLAPVAI